MIRSTCIGLLASLAVLGSHRVHAQDVSLPGNAASLRETHGDWTVSCAIQAQADGKKVKRCVLAQEQIDRETRRRVLTMELRPEGGGVKGTLVLPFGLSLDKGVAYQLDEGQLGAVQRFRTCLPVGCVIDVDFDARTVAPFRTGNTLKVKAIADGGQEMVFSVPLSVFSGAHGRALALSK